MITEVVNATEPTLMHKIALGTSFRNGILSFHDGIRPIAQELNQSNMTKHMAASF